MGGERREKEKVRMRGEKKSEKKKDYDIETRENKPHNKTEEWREQEEERRGGGETRV